jgi:predicted GIY-YIG superfamily endonuclease
MNESCYFTYIVASRSLTLYIGITGNLRKRVFEHKRKLHEDFPRVITAIDWFGSSDSPVSMRQLHARNS